MLCFLFVVLFLATSQMTSLNVPSNSRHFAQVQASGYSPALHRKKSGGILSNSGRLLSWMTESAAPSAAAIYKDKEFLGSHQTVFQHDRTSTDAPQSILVRPDSNKNNIDKVASFSLTSVATFINVCDLSFFSPSASKVSAIPHRWGVAPSQATDLLLVIRDSDPLQLPPQTSSAGSLGPFPHPGKRRAGDHSQRRKGFRSKEGPWNSHLGSEL